MMQMKKRKREFPPNSGSLDNIIHGAMKKAPPEEIKFQFSCVIDKDENGVLTLSQLSLKPISIFFDKESEDE